MKALNKLTVLANQGTAGCTTSLAKIGSAPIASNTMTTASSYLAPLHTLYGKSIGMKWELHGNWYSYQVPLFRKWIGCSKENVDEVNRKRL